MLPALVAQVQDLAPRLRFQIVHAQNQDYAETWPRAGWISRWVMWKTWPSPLPASSFDWLTDHYVVIASRDHPRIRSAPSLDAYLAERHVAVRPWGEAGGHIDKLLERRGLRRDVAVQLPSVLAPFIVAGSALIMTVPRQAARTLGAVASIVEYPPPFEIPPFTLKAYSHVRQRSAAHAWLRELLRARFRPESRRRARRAGSVQRQHGPGATCGAPRVTEWLATSWLSSLKPPTSCARCAACSCSVCAAAAACSTSAAFCCVALSIRPMALPISEMPVRCSWLARSISPTMLVTRSTLPTT